MGIETDGSGSRRRRARIVSIRPEINAPSPAASRSSGIARYILLFFLAFVAVLLCTGPVVEPYDEGVILFGAARVLHGDVLHRDFYANYGPGQFYSLALLFEVFSPSILVERLWDAFTRALSPPLVFAILTGTGLFGGRRWIPATAAVAAVVWLASIGFPGYPVFPALAATLASVACLAPVLARRRSGPARRARLVAAGFLVGVATAFRYDVGFLVAVTEVAVLAARFLCSGPPVRVAAREAALASLWFGLGLALLAAPLILAYVAAGAIDGFVLDIVTLSSRSYVQMRSLPPPGIAALVGNPLTWAVYLPLVAVAAATAVVLAMARQTTDRARIWPVVLLAAITLAAFAKGFVRISGIHMAMAIIASLVLLAILVACASRLGPVVQTLVAVAVILAGACTELEAAQGLAVLARNTAWLRSGADCRTPGGLERLRCFETETKRLDAVRYVRRETAPDEPIFVGLGRHDKIFENDVLFYFLAGRPSATAWHHMDPGVQTTAMVQRRMVAELDRRRTKVVVIETEWDTVAEPNGSAVGSGVTLLDDYIRAHYQPVAHFGDIAVLRRVSDSGPDPGPDPR